MIASVCLLLILAALFATALADDDGREVRPLGPRRFVMKDDAVFYDGSLCLYDPTTGEAEVGSTTSGLRFGGIYRGTRLDNADDGLTAILDDASAYRITTSGAGADDVGKPVYAVDDNTVSMTRTGTAAWCGNIREVLSATDIWVTPPRAVFPTLGGEAVTPETVANPAADGTTNARFTSLASYAASAPTLSRTNGRFTSLASYVASAPAITATTASAVASQTFTSTVTSAEAAGFASLMAALVTDVRALASVQASHVIGVTSALAEAEILGDDVTTVTSVLGSHQIALTSALAEVELVGDAARAGLTYDAAAQAALISLGLLVAA